MIENSNRPPIKVAMIGFGRSALNEHFPVYKAHPSQFQLVAMCDVLKDRRDFIAREVPGCKLFRRYEDMLNEREIDLIDVCTPSELNFKLAVEALSHGFWTLVESPVVLNGSDAKVLRGAATRAKNRLIVMHRGLYDSDFQLARKEMADKRLGAIYQIVIRKEDYVRRDDWQTVKRIGGGAAYYALPDMMFEARRMMPVPPIQMFSELKRIAAVGDSEDYVHVVFKTRTRLSVDIEFNGGALPGVRQPAFTIRGDNGVFTVMPGASEGVLRMFAPDLVMPRRRSSVSSPPLIGDMHENFPVVECPIKLPDDTPCGQSIFWQQVYESVRTGKQFPVSLEDSLSVLTYSYLMKKTSPFGV